MPPATESSPAVANGVVYIGSDDNNVYALNASTGALLWSYNTGNAVGASAAVANGVVYVGTYQGNVDALNASTGALLWDYTGQRPCGKFLAHRGERDGLYRLDRWEGLRLRLEVKHGQEQLPSAQPEDASNRGQPQGYAPVWPQSVRLAGYG